MNDVRLNQESTHNPALPFVAPCRKIKRSAPFNWLRLGMNDLQKAPLASLGFGFAMSILIMVVIAMAWQYGSAWIMLSMLCGFIFIAPLACIGTYAISAQLERHQPVSIRRTLRACFKRHIGTELVITLVLLVIFLVWARASSMISIFLPSNGEYSFAAMPVYSLVLMGVSLLFLTITFAVSAFSLPMIMHRDVDAITAVVTSVNAVRKNKLTMLLWGLIIGIGFILGVASMGIGLVFFLPIVGHATWHGYLETIDASQYPRHKVGITSVKKPA